MAYLENLGSYEVTRSQRKRLDYLSELCSRGSVTEGFVTARDRKLEYHAIWLADSNGRIMVANGVIGKNGKLSVRRRIQSVSPNPLEAWCQERGLPVMTEPEVWLSNDKSLRDSVEKYLDDRFEKRGLLLV